MGAPAIRANLPCANMCAIISFSCGAGNGTRAGNVGMNGDENMPEKRETLRVNFTLPLPPGINQQYTRVGNRRVLSGESRAYKRRAARRLESLRAKDVLDDRFVAALREGYIGLFLDFYFETPLKRDLDGGLKIVQDVICDTLGINDNRVVDIHLLKRIDPLNPRLEVELEVIPDWSFSPTYIYSAGDE